MEESRQIRDMPGMHSDSRGRMKACIPFRICNLRLPAWICNHGTHDEIVILISREIAPTRGFPSIKLRLAEDNIREMTKVILAVVSVSPRTRKTYLKKGDCGVVPGGVYTRENVLVLFGESTKAIADAVAAEARHAVVMLPFLVLVLIAEVLPSPTLVEAFSPLGVVGYFEVAFGKARSRWAWDVNILNLVGRESGRRTRHVASYTAKVDIGGCTKEATGSSFHPTPRPNLSVQKGQRLRKTRTNWTDMSSTFSNYFHLYPFCYLAQAPQPCTRCVEFA